MELIAARDDRSRPPGSPPRPAPPAGRRGTASRRGRSTLIMLAFTSPALVLLTATRLYPAWRALSQSLYRRDDIGRQQFVGLQNYRFLLLDSPTFLPTVYRTLVFVAVTVVAQTILALAIAVLFTQDLPGQAVWRTLVFLPTAVPIAVSVITWGIAFRPDGPLNAVLAAAGLAGRPWLTDTTWAPFSIVVMVSWIGIGYWMIFLVAGLRDVATELREAAAIDGAGPVRTFVSIILPEIRRPLTFVIVADTAANFLVFAPAAILTKGGPEGATNVLMYEIYKQAFQSANPNLAAAEAVLLMIVMLIIVAVQFRVLGTDQEASR